MGNELIVSLQPAAFEYVQNLSREYYSFIIAWYILEGDLF